MKFKYGIYQSSERSCIFYKEDEDGNQSVFNIYNPKKEKEILAYIDNEQMKQNSWHTEKEITINEIMDAFHNWASDAPMLFEMNAQKSIGNCLKSVLFKEEE